MNIDATRLSRAFVLPINSSGRVVAPFARICRCKRSFGLADSAWPPSWPLSSADLAWNRLAQPTRHTPLMMYRRPMRYSRPMTAGGGRPWAGSGRRPGPSRAITAARATGSCSRTKIDNFPIAGTFIRRCSWGCNWWRLRWDWRSGRRRQARSERVRIREPQIPFGFRTIAGRQPSCQRVSACNSRIRKDLTARRPRFLERASIRSTATIAGSHY